MTIGADDRVRTYGHSESALPISDLVLCICFFSTSEHELCVWSDLQLGENDPCCTHAVRSDNRYVFQVCTEIQNLGRAANIGPSTKYCFADVR